MLGVSRDCAPTVSQILSALSYALDLVEGQPRGHAERTAVLSVRLVKALGLDELTQREAYCASLIKDSGCSNNSARIHSIFGGDEILVKRRVKLVDWTNQLASAKFAYQNMAPGGSPVHKLRRMLSSLGSPEETMDSLTRARCTRGAAIASKLGFNKRVADAIEALDEHWDGRGAPNKLDRYEIPFIARIVGCAQTLEVFNSAFGKDRAYSMLRTRKGRWFQPGIVDAAQAFRDDGELWRALNLHLKDPSAKLPELIHDQAATGADIDQICAAFASIVDAKSTFTGEHSTRVCQYSVKLGQYFGFDADRLQELTRAALLHDIGKLGVSNAILDKPDRLTPEEFDAVKLHPRFSYEILCQIHGFERIAELAAAHHERLDGKGYWRGLTHERLDLDMRILAVADVYDALSAERPYRQALAPKRVFEILETEADSGLDAACVSAIKELALEPVPLAA